MPRDFVPCVYDEWAYEIEPDAWIVYASVAALDVTLTWGEAPHIDVWVDREPDERDAAVSHEMVRWLAFQRFEERLDGINS